MVVPTQPIFEGISKPTPNQLIFIDSCTDGDTQPTDFSGISEPEVVPNQLIFCISELTVVLNQLIFLHFWTDSGTQPTDCFGISEPMVVPTQPIFIDSCTDSSTHPTDFFGDF